MTATWLSIFASWVVLATVDLALAVAFRPHIASVAFALIGSMCATFAARALHKANVERRFRHVEATAKRLLLAMEACQERGNQLGFDCAKEQLQACAEQMRRIAEESVTSP